MKFLFILSNRPSNLNLFTYKLESRWVPGSVLSGVGREVSSGVEVRSGPSPTGHGDLMTFVEFGEGTQIVRSPLILFIHVGFRSPTTGSLKRTLHTYTPKTACVTL